MADEYAQIVGHAVPAVITGKPIALGGSLGRGDATARGGFYLLRHLADDLKLGKNLRVVVQGFGNAGQHIARLLASDGHRIVAVSDSSAAVRCDDGLDIERLVAAKAAGETVGSLAGRDGVTSLSGEELLAVDCDVLVPAAMENMIHVGNAGSIRAKAILELANGPVTPEADALLAKMGVVVLPDILANAGGVTVSYFEWVQNRQGYYWTIAEVHERLRSMMEAEGRAIWTISREKGISMRTAAYVHALGRISDAIEAHGTQSFFTS